MAINPIVARDPFRHPGMRGLSNITPFTYRDGMTFEKMLYALKEYISDNVIPELNNELTDIYNDFISSMDGYLDREIQTKAEWKLLFDTFMQNVDSNLFAMNDAVIARLFRDFESQTSIALESTLNQRVDPLVRELMANIVGSDRLIYDAAAAAVNTAAGAMDLVTGQDNRTVRPLEFGTEWAIPFTDAEGNIMGGFGTDGIFRLAQALDAPGSGTADPNRTRVSCIGDSLVYGYREGGEEISFPAALAKLHPGVTFINSGQSGATVDEIRFRVGAMDLYCEINGGVIPASGSVKAIVKQKMGFVKGRNNQYYGSLNGVNGTLATEDDGFNWTFTRASAGVATPTAGKHKIVRAVPDYRNDVVIIWLGRNDVSNNVFTLEPDVESHVIGAIDELVGTLRANNKKFLIASIVNMAAERRGTVAHTRIVEINRRAQEKYPANYVDMRGYLLTQAIYDAGLNPTAADLQNMRDDAPPFQIMDNGSHPLPFMIPHIARKFNEHLEGKAYI